jgi:hypothetical protein
MSFAQACRTADRAQRRKPKDRRIERLPGVRIATLYAAEFLLQVGDVQRWRQWFDAHSATERAGILRYLEKRKGRQGT